jgi:hypothetical protein
MRQPPLWSRAPTRRDVLTTNGAQLHVNCGSLKRKPRPHHFTVSHQLRIGSARAHQAVCDGGHSNDTGQREQGGNGKSKHGGFPWIVRSLFLRLVPYLFQPVKRLSHRAWSDFS